MLNYTTENKMTAMAMKAAARKLVLDELQKGVSLNDLNAEFVGAVPYIPTCINGQEIWVEIKLTSKQFTDTERTPAFDVFEAQEAFRIETEQKEKEKERKKAEKEASAKIRKSK